MAAFPDVEGIRVVGTDLSWSVLSSVGFALSPEAKQQQQQPSTRASQISLLDNEQEHQQHQHDTAVSERHLLQLRAQQATELSDGKIRSQKQTECMQTPDTKGHLICHFTSPSSPSDPHQSLRDDWYTLVAD
ncbi:hypothetical protein cyc_02064 [Cyclospora cayetanensis]|uniref:Uncharacterized protein n=1 Tax=Cyclospora cayetanensis TaxID=88456 RepID=A0A1D3D3W8_9EIME|nr:hypothetical protein cyc_02064 [Cyclospora cayetanensis]